jgi:hypothetical protein
MYSAVCEKLIVRFKDLLFHAFAFGLGRHEFRMVFPDQHYESLREGGEFAG